MSPNLLVYDPKIHAKPQLIFKMSLFTISLPQEIYELFIDALGNSAKDDKQSGRALFQCSRVCRAFWLRSRRHIFSDIRIYRRLGVHSVSVAERLFSLLALLDLNPSEFSETPAPPVISLIQSFSIRATVETFNQLVFARILERFIEARVLHTLNLQSRHDVIWSDINEDTRKLLQNLCQSSHLKTISLDEFVDLIPDIFDGATIKHLILHSVPIEDATPLAALRLPPQLEALDIDNSFPILQARPSVSQPAGALPFSHLKKLVTTIYEPRDLDTACALAQRSSPVLQTLHLSFIFNVHIPSPPFDITQFPDLRHLKLGFTREPTRQGHGTAPLKLLCHFLSASTPLSALETITIEITETQEIQQRIYSFDKDHWRALDKAISKPNLACVRQVNIIARFRIVGLYRGSAFVESAFVKEVRELIEPLFPRLLMNEAIDFEIDIVLDFVGHGFLPIF
ncbi:hypothetical protein BDZ97DRAFT_1949759 [Flammula alnicola]|nr:hypothetical protein BDZ97DRAFT_1949759 [Flammula alnicola]